MKLTIKLLNLIKNNINHKSLATQPIHNNASCENCNGNCDSSCGTTCGAQCINSIN